MFYLSHQKVLGCLCVKDNVFQLFGVQNILPQLRDLEDKFSNLLQPSKSVIACYRTPGGIVARDPAGLWILKAGGKQREDLINTTFAQGLQNATMASFVHFWPKFSERDAPEEHAEYIPPKQNCWLLMGEIKQEDQCWLPHWKIFAYHGNANTATVARKKKISL